MAYDAGGLHLPALLAALVGAMLLQVGTNFCNDYCDWRNGADTPSRKGPVRMTQAGLVSPVAMRQATLAVFLLATAVGVFLIVRGGWPIAVIGVCSILAGVLYSAGRFPLAYLGLGDLFVLTFFGPVATGGTFYVLTLQMSAEVLIAGMAPGLLATAILQVNNIRDREEDSVAGKKTLVVRFGRRLGLGIWAGCVVVAALIPLELLAATAEHRWAALTVLILIPALAMFARLREETAAERLNPLLGQTGVLMLAHSVLFSLGWILG